MTDQVTGPPEAVSVNEPPSSGDSTIDVGETVRVPAAGAEEAGDVEDAGEVGDAVDEAGAVDVDAPPDDVPAVGCACPLASVPLVMDATADADADAGAVPEREPCRPGEGVLPGLVPLDDADGTAAAGSVP